MILRLRPLPPAEPTDTSPLRMDSVLAALHSLHDPISLEIGFQNGLVALFIRAPETSASLVKNQLYAQFPDADITEEPGEALKGITQHLALSHPDLFPIKRYPQFTDA